MYNVLYVYVVLVVGRRRFRAADARPLRDRMSNLTVAFPRVNTHRKTSSGVP